MSANWIISASSAAGGSEGAQPSYFSDSFVYNWFANENKLRDYFESALLHLVRACSIDLATVLFLLNALAF